MRGDAGEHHPTRFKSSFEVTSASTTVPATRRAASAVNPRYNATPHPDIAPVKICEQKCTVTSNFTLFTGHEGPLG